MMSGCMSTDGSSVSVYFVCVLVFVSSRCIQALSHALMSTCRNNVSVCTYSLQHVHNVYVHVTYSKCSDVNVSVEKHQLHTRTFLPLENVGQYY